MTFFIKIRVVFLKISNILDVQLVSKCAVISEGKLNFIFLIKILKLTLLTFGARTVDSPKFHRFKNVC